MKTKYKFFIGFLITTISYGQHYGMDMLKEAYNPHTREKTGLIRMENNYYPGENLANVYGDMEIYLLHKNYPKNWPLVANRRYKDSCQNLSLWCASENLFEKQKKQLNDFDIYIELIDKKYLAPYEETCESGSCIFYRLKEEIDFKTELYYKKHGEKYFKKIKTFDYSNDDELNDKKMVNGKWPEERFVEQKVIEANKGFTPFESRTFPDTFITQSLLSEGDIEQLKLLSKRQLRLLRNAFYARLGYKFKSQDLQDFFNQFGWYQDIVGSFPNDYYTLTKEEKERVDMIRGLERDQ